MRKLYCTGCGGIFDFESPKHRCRKFSADEIAQGSNPWLAWRMGGIGSSDADAIMGTSPWCSALELWERKTGRRRPEPRNFAMQRGLNLEPIARRQYEAITGIKMPAKRAQHKKHDFLRASLDGLNREEGIVLEIKCPNREVHATAKEGIIPRRYLWQCVHQLMVTGLSTLHYFSFDGDDGVLVPFERDLTLEKKLLTAEKKFWDCVVTDTPPARAVPQLFKVRKV